MHVKSLKVFCDVVGQRSFSRAADENGISQSGASQLVHQLEQRLGARLIDRSKRPFVLTPEGEVFYRGCRKLVQNYTALEEEVRTFHQQVEGLVRVASIYSVGLSHMNHDVQQFLATYPKSNVRLQYQHPDRVYELVQRDQVDLGLVSYPKSSRSIRSIAWRNEPMVLVCAAGNPFSTRDHVRLKELDGINMIGFDDGLKIRREIDRAMAACGAEAKVVMEFDNIETIKRAIEIDAGVGLLPEPTVAREVESGTLVAVRLTRDVGNPVMESDKAASQGSDGKEVVPMTRPLGIIYRRGKQLGATARRFIRALRENARTRPTSDDGGHSTAQPKRSASPAEAEEVTC